MALSAAAAGAIGAGVSAGSGLLSGGLSAVYSKNQQQRAIAFQREMYDKQRADNWQDTVQMWRMNNEYNAPTAQMQRLLSAGINPASQFGEGSVVGNSSSAPAPDTPSAPSFPTLSPSFIGDAFRSTSEGILRSMLLKSQIDLNEANATGALSGAERDKAETTRILKTLDPTIANIVSQTNLNDAQKLKVSQDLENSKRLVDAQIADIASEIELRRKQSESIDSNILLNNERMKQIALDMKVTAQQLIRMKSDDAVQIMYNQYITPYMDLIAKMDFDNATEAHFRETLESRIMTETCRILEGTGEVKALEEIRNIMANTRYTEHRDSNIGTENIFKFLGVAIGAFAGLSRAIPPARNKIGF